MRLQQQIMDATECVQSAFYGVATFFEVLSGSEALRGNRLNRRQDVFHAMMEFFHHDALQILGTLYSAASMPALAR